MQNQATPSSIESGPWVRLLPGRRSLLWRLALPMCALVALTVASVGVFTPASVVEATLEDAVTRSVGTAVQLRALRNFYSEHVVAAATRSGTRASPTYGDEPNSIPVPTTFILDAAAAFSTDAVTVKLVSPYPWPSRKGRVLDDFEKGAWDQLSRDPGGRVFRREQVGDREVLRVAVADRMDATCVACHNGNAASPKRDWQVGDVRGLIEVVTSLDAAYRGAHDLSLKLVVCTVLAGLALLAVLLLVGARLTKPLRELASIIRAIVAGRQPERVPHLDRADEIGTVARALQSLQDQTRERARAEARISHMARHDELTGVGNRFSFGEEIERALTRVGRDNHFALLCLDLDRFKSVNDTLGHPVGDALLVEVAQRLRSCIREGDVVARLGGDEFAILQHGTEKVTDAVLMAERIIGLLSEPFDVLGHTVLIGASVGIAFAPADGNEADALLKAADMALYRAKNDGGGVCRLFEPEMDALMQARRELEIHLRQALYNGEFEVHYQPIVSLEQNGITGFEALVRWRHPTRGMVSPAAFIPIAEEIGLIGALGLWVLRTACADATTWPGDLKVAVNLSPVQFRSKTLVADVAAALADTGLPAGRLEIEITETVMLQDTAATLDTLVQLRDIGVRIAMDDFGTGYSSLSYLHRFPFNKIKIDQCFIREMSEKPESMAVLRAITGLGGNLGMTTTAEGVETSDQLARLRVEGCTEVQGFLFSRPKPVGDVQSMLSSVAAQMQGLSGDDPATTPAEREPAEAVGG